MTIQTIDAATYATERAICDKALAYWAANTSSGRRSMSAELAAHPDYAACDNAMRGRVEQYETLSAPPESLVAYVGAAEPNGMGIDRLHGRTYPLTVWTGDAIGYCTLPTKWRSGYSDMFQIYAWIRGKDGVEREYTGRGQGVGMAVSLRLTAEHKRRKAFADEWAADILKGYLVAMLWSSNDESTPEGGEPMDSNYDCDDVADSLLESSRRDCWSFAYQACKWLTADNWQGKQALRYQSELGEQIGHDFWLTRAGHGCGFWDGDWRSDSRCGLDGPLTKLAKAFSDFSPYVGDDGKIYG